MGRCWSRPGLRGGDVEIAVRRAIIHPETDSRLVMGFGKVPEWCQRFRVKLNGTVGIADMQGHMVNHDCHYRRASARSAQALSVSVRRCIDPGHTNTVTTGAHSWWAVVCTISSVARVAQWIEHRSPKAGVARSNRVPGTFVSLVRRYSCGAGCCHSTYPPDEIPHPDHHRPIALFPFKMPSTPVIRRKRGKSTWRK